MTLLGQKLVEDHDDTVPEPWVEPMAAPWGGLAWVAAVSGSWALMTGVAWGVLAAFRGIVGA